MTQQGDYPGGRGPAYTRAAGFGPNGQDPRMRPPVTPEQWQGRAPQSGPYAGQPQYTPRQDPQPAFTPDPWQDAPPPPGQYPPQQPAWQQPYQPPPQYAPGPPPRRKRHTARNVLAGIGGLIGVIIVISVATSGHGTQTPGSSQGIPPAQSAAPAQPAVKAAAKAPAAQTVTYVVSGSTADVTYGPTGTDLSGTVPMHVSKPLGTPLYYSITAQLQGGGSVSCKIEVDGKVISSSTATGGYNLAMCEISPDPLSGQWSNTNG